MDAHTSFPIPGLRGGLSAARLLQVLFILIGLGAGTSASAWTYPVTNDTECDVYVTVDVAASCNLMAGAAGPVLVAAGATVNFTVPATYVVRSVTITASGVTGSPFSWHCSSGASYTVYNGDPCEIEYDCGPRAVLKIAVGFNSAYSIIETVCQG